MKIDRKTLKKVKEIKVNHSEDESVFRVKPLFAPPARRFSGFAAPEVPARFASGRFPARFALCQDFFGNILSQLRHAYCTMLATLPASAT